MASPQSHFFRITIGSFNTEVIRRRNGFTRPDREVLLGDAHAAERTHSLSIAKFSEVPHIEWVAWASQANRNVVAWGKTGQERWRTTSPEKTVTIQRCHLRPSFHPRHVADGGSLCCSCDERGARHDGLQGS